MFPALAEAIEALEVETLDADGLVELCRMRDRLNAKVIAAVSAYQERGTWAGEGASSMIAWLRHLTTLGNGDAIRIAKMADHLRRLPHTAAALADGTLSCAHVAAIVRTLDERVEP